MVAGGSRNGVASAREGPAWAFTLSRRKPVLCVGRQDLTNLSQSNSPRSKAGVFLCALDRRGAKASQHLNDIRGPLRLPLATKPRPSPARPAGNPGVAHIVHALRALPSTGSLGHGHGRPCRHCFLLLSRLQNSATRRASWAIGRTSRSSCAKAAART